MAAQRPGQGPSTQGASRAEGSRAVGSRISGALMRAFLVVIAIATPSVLLPGISGDAKQLVALAALFAGCLTFVEYNSDFPSVTEFRDAAPYNRLRFVMLLATVLGLTMIERGRTDPNSLTELSRAIGHLIGKAGDFPYSPVRLATLMLADSATAEQVMIVRDAAGLAYFTSLVTLSIFVTLVYLQSWPLRTQPFNVWVNLPTFDPTVGGDVVDRLERDGRINIALGFLLPFVTPFFVSLASRGLNPLSLTSPQTLIWTMTLWAFLPASLFMRGIAIGRVADMIRAARLARDKARDEALATA